MRRLNPIIMAFVLILFALSVPSGSWGQRKGATRQGISYDAGGSPRRHRLQTTTYVHLTSVKLYYGTREGSLMTYAYRYPRGYGVHRKAYRGHRGRGHKGYYDRRPRRGYVPRYDGYLPFGYRHFYDKDGKKRYYMHDKNKMYFNKGHRARPRHGYRY